MSQPGWLIQLGCVGLKTINGKNMLGQVLIVDLEYSFSWGLLVETKFIFLFQCSWEPGKVS